MVSKMNLKTSLILVECLASKIFSKDQKKTFKLSLMSILFRGESGTILLSAKSHSVNSSPADF